MSSDQNGGYVRVLRAFMLHVLAGFALLSLCGDALASPVTITGGFVGYSGQTTCTGVGFNTFIAGQNVTHTGSPCVNGFSVVPLTFSYPSTTSVDFKETGAFGFVDNNLTFTPASNIEVANIADQFLLGTLSYTNGTWLSTGNNAALFNILLVTSSPDSAFNGAVLDDSITLDITENLATNTPAQNADRVRFTNFSAPGFLSIFELADSPIGSNVGSAQVFGRITASQSGASILAGSTLIPTQFANFSGGTPLATAPPVVPEPGTILLLTTGVAARAIGSRIRRRRRPSR